MRVSASCGRLGIARATIQSCIHNMAMVGRPGTVVGALACQKDSYLRSLKTIVLSCTPIAVEAKSKGKSKGKGKGKEKEKDTAEGDVTGPLYEVELQDTVLFPEFFFNDSDN